MDRHMLSITLVVLALAAPALAQTNPDLSGTWVLDKDKSDPMPQRPGGSMDMTLTIKHTAQEMLVSRLVGERTTEAKYSMSGGEDTNQVRGGESKTKSRWDQGKLVIEGMQKMSFQGQDVEMSLKDEYSLSADGKVLTLVTTRNTPRGEMTRKQIFNRK